PGWSARGAGAKSGISQSARAGSVMVLHLAELTPGLRCAPCGLRAARRAPLTAPALRPKACARSEKYVRHVLPGTQERRRAGDPARIPHAARGHGAGSRLAPRG